MKHRIAVVFFCDSNYHDMTLFSLASLARAHRGGLDIHMKQSQYSRALPARLQGLVRDHGHQLLVESLSLNGTTATTGRDTALFKADALDGLTKQYDYVFYIDGDTLTFDDLDLESLAGFPELFAACMDLSVTAAVDDPEFHRNCTEHGISPDYFNSGVIFINSAEWISGGAFDRYKQHLARHKGGCLYIRNCVLRDQCAWNRTVDGNWRRLPTSMNVQKIAMHTDTWRDAKVRHYTGKKKFIPVRNHTCDRKEFALLRALSRESGLPLPQRLYWDGGVTNWLNRVRRYQDVARAQETLSRLNA